MPQRPHLEEIELRVERQGTMEIRDEAASDSVVVHLASYTPDTTARDVQR